MEQLGTMHTQIEAMNNVVRKLEEKERILQTTIANLEKELRYTTYWQRVSSYNMATFQLRGYPPI